MKFIFLIICILLIFFGLLFSQDKKQMCFSYEQKIVYSKLIAELESYRSPQEIQTILGKDVSWETIRESKLDKGDPRPPYGLTEVSVNDFSHFGFRGELQLVFFNDRLMSTTFHPVEFQQYLKSLIETQKLRFKNVYYKHKEAKVAPYTRISVPSEDYMKEFDGKLSVTWEDTRLIAERDAWILKYS